MGSGLLPYAMKAFVVGALERRFDTYGDDCTSLDAEYGWRTVGLALLAMGDREFLERRRRSSDRWLAWAAYEVLFVPQSPVLVELVRPEGTYADASKPAPFLLQPYDIGERLAVEAHKNAPENAPARWRRERPCPRPRPMMPETPTMPWPWPESPEPAGSLPFEPAPGPGFAVAELERIEVSPPGGPPGGSYGDPYEGDWGAGGDSAGDSYYWLGGER